VNTADLVTNSQIWAKLTLDSISGTGRVLPRLHFVLRARTSREAIRVWISQLNARLTFDGELLGTGVVGDVGEEVPSLGDKRIHLEVFVDRDAIRFVQDHSRGSNLSFELEFRGALHVRDDRPEGEGPLNPELQRGEWRFVSIKPARLPITLARSDWVTNVLEPLGIGEYVSMEIPLPGVPERERWRAALRHVEEAQKHFGMGNDAAVLQSCHAAFESLEGAPKHILDGVTDGKKREVVDELLKQTKSYFNSGRHVSKSDGSQKGSFPVDHRDAEFALYLSRVFLAYIAKLLASGL
jgi:hypothetical protein